MSAATVEKYIAALPNHELNSVLRFAFLQKRLYQFIVQYFHKFSLTIRKTTVLYNFKLASGLQAGFLGVHFRKMETSQ